MKARQVRDLYAWSAATPAVLILSCDFWLSLRLSGFNEGVDNVLFGTVVICGTILSLVMWSIKSEIPAGCACLLSIASGLFLGALQTVAMEAFSLKSVAFIVALYAVVMMFFLVRAFAIRLPDPKSDNLYKALLICPQVMIAAGVVLVANAFRLP